MARLQFPAHVSSVSVDGHNFEADQDGVVDTGTVPGEVVERLMASGQCRVLKDDQVSFEERKNQVTERAELIAILQEANIKMDGRASIATLRSAVAKLEADRAVASGG